MWLNRTRGLPGGGDPEDGSELQMRSGGGVGVLQKRKRQPQCRKAS